MTAATVIIPTHEHAETLPFAVDSVLAQSVRDLEVFVIGDGVDEATRAAALASAAGDERVTFVDRRKGQRHGEAHRHEVLGTARADVVCYLSDDDLWLPDHVETMAAMLHDADFVHALPVRVRADGSLETLGVDLRERFWRERLLHVENRIPLSCMAHTRVAYRRLPFGWRPAPLDVFTDLYMIRQFLEQPGLRFASSSRATVVNFPSPWRVELSGVDRLAELERWAERLSTTEGRTDFRDRVDAARFFERNGVESHALQLGERVLNLDRLVAHLEQGVAERTAEVERLQSVERELAETRIRLREMHELAVERFDVIEAQESHLHELEAGAVESERRGSALTVERENARREVAAMSATLTWRLRGRLLRSPIVGSVLRTIGARRAR